MHDICSNSLVFYPYSSLHVKGLYLFWSQQNVAIFQHRVLVNILRGLGRQVTLIAHVDVHDFVIFTFSTGSSFLLVLLGSWLRVLVSVILLIRNGDLLQLHILIHANEVVFYNRINVFVVYLMLWLSPALARSCIVICVAIKLSVASIGVEWATEFLLRAFVWIVHEEVAFNLSNLLQYTVLVWVWMYVISIENPVQSRPFSGLKPSLSWISPRLTAVPPALQRSSMSRRI
jgi:hypothetical protein